MGRTHSCDKRKKRCRGLERGKSVCYGEDVGREPTRKKSVMGRIYPKAVCDMRGTIVEESRRGDKRAAKMQIGHRGNS